MVSIRNKRRNIEERFRFVKETDFGRYVQAGYNWAIGFLGRNFVPGRHAFSIAKAESESEKRNIED